MKKNIKRILISIPVLIIILLLFFCFTLRGELSTLLTLHKINNHPMYEVSFQSDYYLNEYRKSGAATDKQLTQFVTGKILKFIPAFKANPDGACSTFQAVTPDHEILFGRNFDYYPSSILVVHTTPKNAYRSISIVNLNHIGYDEAHQPSNLFNQLQVLAAPYIVLDGMNEKGLAVGVLVVKEQIVHQNTGKLPVTTTAALRMLLDYASTVDEAISLLQTWDMNSSGSTGYHFQIADASGDSAVIEYINNELKILHKGSKDYLAATNFTLSTPEQNGGGKDRYQILVDRLEASQGILTEEEAMQLLSDAKFDAMKVSGGDPTNEYYNCSTQWSVVYNLTKKTIQLCTGADYSNTYHYTLQPLN